MANARSQSLLRPLLVLIAAVALLMVAGAVPALAVQVTTSTGGTLQVMPQILLGSQDFAGNSLGQNPNPSPLFSRGGPVLHSQNIYPIYWDPSANSYPPGYPQGTKVTIDQFLQDTGIDTGQRSNIFSLDGQYTDSTGRAAYAAVYRGAFTDLANYPAAGCSDPNASGNICLTAAQVQTELQNMISRFGLPHGLNNVYLLFTPPLVVVCTDATGTDCSGGNGSTVANGTQPGFCAYHAFMGTGVAPYSDTSAYAVLPSPGSQPKSCQADGQGSNAQNPWIQLPNEQKQEQPVEPNLASVYPDYADVLIDNAAHELNGMMTDPLLNAWQDPATQEAPDKCLAQAYGGQASGNGFDPWAWPELVGETGAAAPTLGKTPQGQLIVWGTLNNSPINTEPYWLHGEWNNAENNCELSDQLSPKFVAANPVNGGDLVGFDATSTLSTMGVVTYAWNFGDGTTSGAAPVTAPSIYHVYAGPGVYHVTLTATDSGGYSASFTQDVTVLGTPLSTAPPGGGTPGSPAGPGTGGGGAVLPAPTVTESILSRSLSRVIKNGLSVNYSVNQTVAGHFQVLLDKHVAQRLHIGGASAPGFGPTSRNGAVVIGFALLVASRAGHSTMSIKLSKAASSRLHHTSSLQIAVRVMVSNDGRHSATVTKLLKLGR